MTKILMIAAGGAAGAVSRYTVAYLGQKLVAGSFPMGTLLVNLMGCFLIGFIGMRFLGPALVREEYRLLVLTGFLGAFTTFSTFGFETFQLLNDGQRGLAFTNIAVSNIAGLALVWLGYRLAERIYGV